MILRRVGQAQRPVPGTRLLREYQGVEYIATVTRYGFEYQGRPQYYGKSHVPFSRSP